MPSTFGTYEIAKSGMMTYNTALQTTFHNVANIETEGYSRQTTNVTSIVGKSNSFTVQGYGVDVTSISRERNEYYDTKYQMTRSKYNKYNTETYYMNSIQDAICGNVTADSKSRIMDAFDDFNASLSNLVGNPNSDTIRTQMATRGQTFAQYVNDMATSLQQLQDEANIGVKNCVEEINAYAKKIVAINRQINMVEGYGSVANDLRDQRSLLIDELSQYCNVEVLEKMPPDGVGVPQYYVYVNGGILVDTYSTNLLEIRQKDTTGNINDISGCYDIYWEDGVDFIEHNSYLGGQLQALLEVRDGNNGTVLEGTIKEGSLINDADTGQIKLTLTDTTCDDVLTLNIPNQDGELIVRGRVFAYESFEVKVGDDGKFSYEFTLKSTQDVEDAKYLQNAMKGGYTINIGESVDCKGIPYYMAQLNEFVRTYAKEFNAVHNEGLDADSKPGLDFFTATLPTSTEDLILEEYGSVNASGEKYDPSFSSCVPKDGNVASYYYMTALNIHVSQEVLGDPGKIAGQLPTGDGSSVGNDNGDNIQRLSQLKDKSDMFIHGEPDSFIQSLTATLAVSAEKAATLSLSQSNLLYAIDSNRKSVSGVDEDEEGADMLLFQNMLNNQYKVLSVLNEVLDKLINGMV